jgi:hypothetical protein
VAGLVELRGPLADEADRAFAETPAVA